MAYSIHQSKTPNAYIRARIKAIESYLTNNRPLKRNRNDAYDLLTSGFVHDEVAPEIEAYIQTNESKFSNDKLHFTEIGKYSNFFVVHPEKLCGKEQVTSSMHFPITVKGTKADVEKAINATLKGATKQPNNFEFELLLLEQELNLLELEQTI